MASSWGDERITHRFRSNEIWLDVHDFDGLVDETEKLVEKLERVSAALAVPEGNLALQAVPSPA